MRVNPIGKYLFVKVTRPAEQGGIVLPDAHQAEDEVVEVLGVGPEVTMYHRGDRILCIPGSGVPTPVKDHVLVREQDVVAVVKE